jgi:hypothetical protein
LGYGAGQAVGAVGRAGSLAGKAGSATANVGTISTRTTSIVNASGFNVVRPPTVASVRQLSGRPQIRRLGESPWKNPDGSINWPPNNGAIPGTEQIVTLQPGQTIGRYGILGQIAIL